MSSQARQKSLFSASIPRASSRARYRGPPLGLDTESLLSGSAERERWLSLALDEEGLLSGSTQRASSQAQPKGSPLSFGTKGPFSGSSSSSSSSSSSNIFAWRARGSVFLIIDLKGTQSVTHVANIGKYSSLGSRASSTLFVNQAYTKIMTDWS